MIFHVPDVYTFLRMIKSLSCKPYVHACLVKRRIDNQKSTNLPVVSRAVIVLSSVDSIGTNLLRMEHVIPPTVGMQTDAVGKYYWNIVDTCKKIAIKYPDTARFGNDDTWVHGVLPLTQVMSDELMITPSKSDIESITSVYE